MNKDIGFKHQFILAVITPICMILASLLTYFLVDRFSAEESKVQISLDIMQLIGDIQPNVSIKLQEEIGSQGDQLILKFDYYNSGPYTVFVDDLPKLKLFIPTSENMITEDKELVEGKDYEVVQHGIKRLSPKQKVTHTMGVIVKRQFSVDRFFYGLSVNIDTDSRIIKLSEQLLSDYLSEEDISRLARGSFYVYGLLLP